ncbi:MAG: hypothetical protein ACLUES_11470 [Flavonifractor plautii]
MSIVKMKRLRLIGMQAERESLLRLLQHMGCVEIDEPPHLGDDPEWAALTRPDPGALNAARDARSRVEGALRTLKKYGPKQKGGLLKPRPVVTEEELFDDAAYEAGLADAGRLGELERQITALYAEQNKLRTQRLALAPWLALDIPLETASTPEVAVSFGTVAASADLDALERELAEKSELTQVLRAGADTQLQYLVFLCHRSAEEACQEVLKEYGFSRAILRGWTGTRPRTTNGWRPGQAEAARTLEEAIAAVAGFAPRRAALEPKPGPGGPGDRPGGGQEPPAGLRDGLLPGRVGARARGGEAAAEAGGVHLLLGDVRPGAGGLPGGARQA